MRGLKIALVTCLVTALLLGGFVFGYWLYSSGNFTSEEEKIENDNTSPLTSSGMEVISEEEQTLRDMEKYKLKKYTKELENAIRINHEVQAWLNIPNTNISKPVPINKSKECPTHKKVDNCYYLTRALDGTYAPDLDENAVVFADSLNDLASLDSMSRNTIIYGHNWTNCQIGGAPLRVADERDKMFAQLPSFADLEFAKKTQYFTLDLKDEQVVVVIFAAFYTDTYNPTNPDGFYYIDPDPSEDEFRYILSEARARSENIYKVPVTYEDKIVTLSTCTGAYGPTRDQRFVVMGRVLREDEDIKDFAPPIKNPKPKRPEL